jgi:predicted GH43/DUF377 family glycosyl hydrolase
MAWVKKGLIFENDPELWWSKKYAGIPTVDVLNEETLRIYYYSMTDNFDGRISFIDVDAANPSRVIFKNTHPVLDLGEPGTFDDCGVCPSCIISINGKKHLFYLGVQRAEKTPYMYFAGVAVESESGSFNRIQKTPILDRTPEEPYTRSATTILKIGNSYKMWYVSAFEWFSWNNRLYPKYIIRSATSDNGLNWAARPENVLQYQNEFEFGFGRPWVMHEDSKFKMYYSVRSTNEPYKMGYAESDDGIHWVRMDHAFGLVRSESGWDSEMICYPCVVDTKYGRYCFYNGNSHGATGFGYAKWEG